MRLWSVVFAAMLAVSQLNAAPLLQANVASGTLQGKEEGAVSAFLGIPYAAPPVGPNRWRAPQPVAAWQGVRQATQFGANCIQAIVPGNGFGPWTPEYLSHGAVSEDCLFLNVWAPAQSADRHLPVLVWIHGGGFNQGSGSVPIYDGAALAAKGIVVVSINYRLSTLGFLALPELSAESPDHVSGNYGVLDTIAALKWVQNNISAFGGDPRAVTIAGQSAGAAMVLDLDVAPQAKGLYARAIAQSGAGLGLVAPDLKQAEATGVQYAQSKNATSLAALRALPADQLVPGILDGLRFAPIADGVVIPGDPAKLAAEGRFNDTPFLTGLTADEMTGLNPKAGSMTADECVKAVDAMTSVLADRFRAAYLDGNCNDGIKRLARDKGLASTYFWAEDRLKTAHQPVFLYMYTHAEPGPEAARYGAFHSSEIPYVFQTLDASPERPFTSEDRAISDKMADYWVNFVKTGNPNGADLPEWPSASTGEVMELGDFFHAQPVLPPQTLKLMQEYRAQDGRMGLF